MDSGASMTKAFWSKFVKSNQTSFDGRNGSYKRHAGHRTNAKACTHFKFRTFPSTSHTRTFCTQNCVRATYRRWPLYSFVWFVFIHCESHTRTHTHPESVTSCLECVCLIYVLGNNHRRASAAAAATTTTTIATVAVAVAATVRPTTLVGRLFALYDVLSMISGPFDSTSDKNKFYVLAASSTSNRLI